MRFGVVVAEGAFDSGVAALVDVLRTAERVGPRLPLKSPHTAFFADPDGNALMLHHRYAPRGGETDP